MSDTIKWPEAPGPGWHKNEGIRPDFASRVKVLLMNGNQPFDVTVTRPDCKPGWAVETTRWNISRPRQPFDVAWFKPL